MTRPHHKVEVLIGKTIQGITYDHENSEVIITFNDRTTLRVAADGWECDTCDIYVEILEGL